MEIRAFVLIAGLLGVLNIVKAQENNHTSPRIEVRAKKPYFLKSLLGKYQVSGDNCKFENFSHLGEAMFETVDDYRFTLTMRGLVNGVPQSKTFEFWNGHSRIESVRQDLFQGKAGHTAWNTYDNNSISSTTYLVKRGLGRVRAMSVVLSGDRLTETFSLVIRGRTDTPRQICEFTRIAQSLSNPEDTVKK